MGFLKTSWEKEKREDIPIDVMNHIAARGSFVVVKSKRLFREISDTAPPAGISGQHDGTLELCRTTECQSQSGKFYPVDGEYRR